MFYSIREGLAGLLRARVASSITISIISLSLLLIGFFLIFVFNANRLVGTIRDRIELEAFIDNSYTDQQIEALQMAIESMDGVAHVTLVTKEQAAEIFKQQFDENIFDILDENPLPASFQIALTKEFRTSAKAGQLVSRLEHLPGIDDIEFRSDLLLVVERYMNYAMIGVTVIGVLLLIGSITLISNTIKLVILSRIRIIETMRLVGATNGFIRRPFVFEGIFQGVIGALIATSIFYAFVKVVNIEIPKLIIVDSWVYLILVGLGFVLGWIGSLMAMQRFLKF